MLEEDLPGLSRIRPQDQTLRHHQRPIARPAARAWLNAQARDCPPLLVDCTDGDLDDLHDEVTAYAVLDLAETKRRPCCSPSSSTPSPSPPAPPRTPAGLLLASR